MASSATGGDDSGRATVSLTVKFSGRTIPITNLSVDSTIKDLKALLQPLTNVLPRGQKLICKGASFWIRLILIEWQVFYSLFVLNFGLWVFCDREASGGWNDTEGV